MEIIVERQRHIILVALNDSISSRAVIDFLITLPLFIEDCVLHLFHFLRKPSASEDLMGKKFSAEQPKRMLSVLENAKDRLVAAA